MIDWKKHTQKNIPEILDADPSEITCPMGLWIELRYLFDEAINEKNEDLIQRIFTEAHFYLDYSGQPNDLGTAAALAFVEHLLDHKKKIPYALKYFPKEDFIGCKELLTYHNNERKYYKVLKLYNQ